MFTNPAITITVTGGSFEDNTQICNLVHNALRNQGMTNVSAEASIAGYIDESPEMTQALRRLNPDLFDTPVVIANAGKLAIVEPFLNASSISQLYCITRLGGVVLLDK